MKREMKCEVKNSDQIRPYPSSMQAHSGSGRWNCLVRWRPLDLCGEMKALDLLGERDQFGEMETLD